MLFFLFNQILLVIVTCIDVQMNFDSIVNVTNTVVDEVITFVSNINYTAVFEDIFTSSGNIFKSILDNICSPISFTELQTSLATVFLIIISINLTFIWISWNKYGGVITDRFIRPSMFSDMFSQYTKYQMCLYGFLLCLQVR